MTRHRGSRHISGMTLLELMVSLALAMVLSLAVFSVLSTFEGRKRILTAGNDAEQAGQVALYRIDGWIRSAGAGLNQAADHAYGCPLHAAKSGTQLLPRTTALAPPFANVDPGAGGVFRLAPVLILPGQTTPGVSGTPSDVLVLMAGVPNGGSATLFSDPPGTATLSLKNSVDFGGGDLVLLGDRQASSDGMLQPCMVEQVASGFTGGESTTVTMGGSYYAATIGNASLAAFSDSGFALRLGNMGSGASSAFLLLGVGDHNVLYSYDLLATSGTPLQAEADGVFELHALYGVDTDNDGKVDSWISPYSNDYTVAALSDGTPAAATRLRQIRALRVGLIMRAALPQRQIVTTGPLKLFSDLDPSLQYARPLSDAERRYRYRTIEETVPVRNNLILAGR